MTNLRFDEMKYPRSDNCRNVTTVVASMYPEFNAQAAAERKAPKVGKTAAQLLAEWEAKGETSRVRGRAFHLYAEEMRKYGEERTKQSIELAGLMRAFNSFNVHHSHLESDTSELKVAYEPYLLKGRIDEIVFDTQVNRYRVVDWKTGKPSTYGFDPLFVPFQYFYNSNMTTTSFQACIYTIILEKVSGIEFAPPLGVWFQDDWYEVRGLYDVRRSLVDYFDTGM